MVFNDHLSITKIYYVNDQHTVLLSNKFRSLSNIAGAPLSPENLAIHSLHNHFVGGVTIAENIRFTDSATLFRLNTSGRLEKSPYWRLSELLELEKIQVNHSDFVDFFSGLIRDYLGYTDPDKISLSLTGGLDSRLILSSLLRYSVHPSTFTFGNPDSGDVSIARKISESFNLDFHNHYLEKPDSAWFKEMARRSLEDGNALAHYHRAFRWQGILDEFEKRPDTHMALGGFMGGEGIKGVYYDNLIITEFAKTWCNPQNRNKEILEDALKRDFFKAGRISLDYLMDFLDTLPWNSPSVRMNEYYFNFVLIASNHLSQDINFYHLNCNYFLNPFMDIDYLYFLFGSPFHMLLKENTSGNQLKRLDIPRLHCRAIYLNNKKLSKIPLSNGYRPADYIISKYLYAVKRGLNKRFARPLPPHFSYGNWFDSYIRESMTEMGDELREIIDYDMVIGDLESGISGIDEGSWHKYTSLVMFNDMIHHYGRN
jgi:hypothetical protein